MDLLALARDLFNAPQMTEQQAADRFRQNATASADLATANKSIESLNKQVTDLKASVPKPLDEEVRAERLIRVTERAESLNGTFTPADSKALLGDLVGLKFDADGKPDMAASKVDEVMLARAPGATDCRAAVILGRLRTCKPCPPSGHSAEWEAAKRKNEQQQGGGNEKSEEQKALDDGRSAGAAFQKSQLQSRGISS